MISFIASTSAGDTSGAVITKYAHRNHIVDGFAGHDVLLINDFKQMIESIPNISEGRNLNFIRQTVNEIEQTDGANVIDYSSDASHHRTVLTITGSELGIQNAILATAASAIHNIDLRQHNGIHPRIGAIDVVPLVPLVGATLEQCIALSHSTGQLLAEKFNIPVFLYESSSRLPHRTQLEQIRKGGFERLETKLQHTDWRPDYGPPKPHPSAGACVIGARKPLIAFNVNLHSHNLTIAKKIALTIRSSNGGLPFVKALGLLVSTDKHDGVQISINLTDYRQTPFAVVLDAVFIEAGKYNVEISETELIGLIPAEAVVGRVRNTPIRKLISPDQILESRSR